MFGHQNQGSRIWGCRDIKRFRPRHIQGLPSLNVGISPSCRGPQIKKNSVKFFCKFANFFFAIFWNFFNVNVCLKVHSFSYNNSILHNFFY